MSLWPLLDRFMPEAGGQSFPFRNWQQFFEQNMGDGDSDPLALLRLALQSARSGQPGRLPNASLELAVRLRPQGISGAAIIGVPRPGRTMASSLARQRQMLAQLWPAPASGLALFDAIYPPDVDFDWLAPEARGLYFAIAYRASNPRPLLKGYFTSSLDNTRTHQEIIGRALDTLGLGDKIRLARQFDEEFSPFSSHRGIGVDLQAGQPAPRVKLYQRVHWLERGRVEPFATAGGLLFSNNLWEKCQYFCPGAGKAGLAREFELALDLQEQPRFKTNFFLNENGQILVHQFLQNIVSWPTDSFEEICGACEAQRYFIHGIALSQVGTEPEEINLYFMR